MCIRARLGALEHHSAARPADLIGVDPVPTPEQTLNHQRFPHLSPYDSFVLTFVAFGTPVLIVICLVVYLLVERAIGIERIFV